MAIKKGLKLNTVVDTVQLSALKEDITHYGYIEADNVGYIKASENVRAKDNYSRLKMSPKHYIGYDNTNSRTKLERATMDILDKIGVHKENIEVDRVDISIDSPLNYDDSFKLHLYLFELITFKEKNRGKIICTSLDNYRDNNIYLNSRDLKLSIYNKALESEGLHKYDTRMEFRWCRYASLDTKKLAEKTLSKLKDIEANDDELTARMVYKLSERYTEEMAIGKVRNFTEFVRKYDKFFYSREILKGVYEKSSLKGSFTGWFKYFKEANSFDYYSLKDIKTYRDLMVKSIKSYIKS